VLHTFLRPLQDLILYHPRRYPPNYILHRGNGTFVAKEMQGYLRRHHGLNLRILHSSDSNGRKGFSCAFLILPRKVTNLRDIKRWMVCLPGNNMLALDFSGFVVAMHARLSRRRFSPRSEPPIRATTTGWLLIDYPGYGFCDGSCEPDTVVDIIDRALAALNAEISHDRNLGKKVPQDTKSIKSQAEPLRVRFVGHSLGGAAVIRYLHRLYCSEAGSKFYKSKNTDRKYSASQNKVLVERAVLSATFTSLAEVASTVLRRTVPSGVIQMGLPHRWDSLSAVHEMKARWYSSGKDRFDLNGIEKRNPNLRMTPIFEDALPRFLFIHGMNDSLVPVDMAYTLGKAIPPNDDQQETAPVLALLHKGHNDLLPMKPQDATSPHYLSMLF